MTNTIHPEILVINLQDTDYEQDLLSLSIEGINQAHYHSLINQIFSYLNLDVRMLIQSLPNMPNINILRLVLPGIRRNFTNDEMNALHLYTSTLSMAILSCINDLNILSHYPDGNIMRLDYYVEIIQGNRIYLTRMKRDNEF